MARARSGGRTRLCGAGLALPSASGGVCLSPFVKRLETLDQLRRSLAGRYQQLQARSLFPSCDMADTDTRVLLGIIGRPFEPRGRGRSLYPQRSTE